MAKQKTDIDFTCHPYTSRKDGVYTLFYFYLDSANPHKTNKVWDEDKLTLDEALLKYPPKKFNWIFFANN